MKEEEKKETKKSIIDHFEIVTRKSTKTGNDYFVLVVYTCKGKSADLFLSESQKALVDEVGLANVNVDVEARHSDAKKKDYDVIALHVGDEETFDFFPSDRAFISLAKLQAKKAGII